MSERNPIDVYFCHIPNVRTESAFRDHLARACLERWRLDPHARLVLLQPTGTQPLCSDVPIEWCGDVERFHNARYRVSQARSRAEWFVIADDDCLPLGGNFVARGLATATAHPAFGVLAATDVVGPSPSSPYDVGVADLQAVGGICFVSPKCPLFDFDVGHPTHADGARDSQVRRAGLREGRLLGVRMNHVGYGYSTAAEGHWYAP